MAASTDSLTALGILTSSGKIDWERLKTLNIPDEFESIAWNDAYFREKYLPLCQVDDEVELSTSRTCAKAFLNWYCTGVTIDNPSDVLLGIFYGMTTDGDQHKLFSSNLWNVPGGKTLKNPGVVIFQTTLPYENSTLRITRHAGQTASSSNGTSAVGQLIPQRNAVTTALEWYTKVWKLIESTEIFTSKMAINYVGFLALKLLRSSVKEPEAVSRHIYELSFYKFIHLWNGREQSLRRFVSLWNDGSDLGITIPPHDFTLTRFALMFKRFSPNCTRVLAAIVFSYVDVEPISQDTVRGILEAGCLLSLDKFGLGIFCWTQRAAETLGISVTKLMRCNPIDQHRGTNGAVSNILTDFVNPSKNQGTWPWARMFCDGAFPQLGIKQNYTYVAIMRAIAGGCKANDPMWKLPYFQNLPHGKSFVLECARKICDDQKKEYGPQSRGRK